MRKVSSSKRSSKEIKSSSRSLALERAYVHDVYTVIARECNNCSPVRSHIKEFLFDQFEYGSILLDIGCGDGKYLNLKPDIVTIGLEKCYEWFCNDLINCQTNKFDDIIQLIAGDVMSLPFRDEFFDGVLCSGVLHHICTSDRRIRALKEMTRILKIGGKLLLTVTSGPVIGRELQSQDVLLRWESLRHGRSNASDDTTSNTSSSSGSSNYALNNNTMYESCNSPSSDFGSCYTFMKKALQRFSLSGGVYPRSVNVVTKSKTTVSSSLSPMDEFPIELRNIDDDQQITAENDDSPKETINTLNNKYDRKQSFTQNIVNGSSLFSLIRDHIISFQLQLKGKNDSNQSPNKRNGFLSRRFSHRFSLPLHFERDQTQDSVLDAAIDTKFSILNEETEYGEKTEYGENKSNSSFVTSKCASKVAKCSDESGRENTSVLAKALQRSFSSDSLDSRHASVDSRGGTLLAYYSMPELRSLIELPLNDIKCKFNRNLKNRPKLSELHPITFLYRNTKIDTVNDKSETELSEKNAEDIDKCESCESSQELKNIFSAENNINESVDILEHEEMIDCIEQRVELEKTHCNKVFPKKLLRQRSFSADYQPEVPKSLSEQRRFSASPNIGSGTRTNQIAHHQQMSVDSDESFITIIPAIRSTRESVADVFNDGFADYDKDSLPSSSENDDDACCEEINNQFSDDNTSASIVTTKSVEKSDNDIPLSSTPSPPKTLHRYFHIFRSGELEQLIEQNIQDLHVINSYYNEHATSWCVICEKVQVWTI